MKTVLTLEILTDTDEMPDDMEDILEGIMQTLILRGAVLAHGGHVSWFTFKDGTHNMSLDASDKVTCTVTVLGEARAL